MGHILRKDQEDILRQSLDYHPEGKSNRGRLDNAWKETNKRKYEQIGPKWEKLKAQREITK